MLDWPDDAPTIEEWGTSREAIAGLHAAMSFWDRYELGQAP